MIASVVATYTAIMGTCHRKPIGREQFVRCVNPGAHKNGDADPSLRINEEKDMWHCPVCGAGGKSIALVIHAGLAPDKPAALAWLREHGLSDDAGVKHHVRRFYYDGAEGEVFTDGAVDRIEPGYGGKTKSFVQYRKLANGEYAKGLDGKKLPLYRRLEVLAACRAGMDAFDVEGEVKVERLRHALQEAGRKEAVTTVAGGAKAKLLPEMATDFQGPGRVSVLSDADGPGRRAADSWAREIKKYCPAKEVRVIDFFPDRDDGSDVHDWLDAGHKLDELDELVKNAKPLSLDAMTTENGRSENNVDEPEWDELHPWPTLDRDALYGLPGSVVKTIEPISEAAPAAVLFTFLQMFGNAVGGGPHLVLEGTQHPAKLSVCVAGKTSRARKGSSLSQVRSIFQAVDEDYVHSNIIGGLASGEGLIANLPPDAAGYRRALVVEPEFSRVLTACAREGSTLSPILRQAWDDDRLQVRTRKDPVCVDGAYISLLGHITLDELRARLTSGEAANGFANRILFVCAERSKLLPLGGRLTGDKRATLANEIRSALLKASDIGEVSFSAEAAELWCQMYGEFEEPGGLLGALTARADTQTLRLALIYALSDGLHIIQKHHLIAARAAWQYAYDSAAHIFGSQLGDPVQDRLLEAARAAYPGGLNGEEQDRLFGKRLPARRLREAREALVKRGRLNLKPEPSGNQGGRPRIVVFAVPKNERKNQEKPQSGSVTPGFSAVLSQNGQAENRTDQKAASIREVADRGLDL